MPTLICHTAVNCKGFMLKGVKIWFCKVRFWSQNVCMLIWVENVLQDFPFLVHALPQTDPMISKKNSIIVLENEKNIKYTFFYVGKMN